MGGQAWEVGALVELYSRVQGGALCLARGRGRDRALRRPAEASPNIRGACKLRKQGFDGILFHASMLTS